MTEAPLPLPRHDPVMLRECLDWLRPAPGGIFLDGTLGLGGHAEAVLEQLAPTGCLVGLDRDAEALSLATARLQAACVAHGWPQACVRTFHANVHDAGQVLQEAGIHVLDGCLFDFGVSSYQLDTPSRGFSFRQAGPLDMRMDSSGGRTAWELLHDLTEEDLARVLWEYGEERYSRRIARRICERRVRGTLESTTDLEAAAWDAYPAAERHGRLHPATRTFQAVRIAVNEELSALAPALEAAAALLAPGGCLVTLTYHSLEDRLVKQTLAFLAGQCRCAPELPFCVCGTAPRVRLLVRRPAVPTPEEVERNPRARSARLRVCARVQDPGSGDAPSVGQVVVVRPREEFDRGRRETPSVHSRLPTIPL